VKELTMETEQLNNFSMKLWKPTRAECNSQ
jgi:hypothetical protein